MGLAAANVLPTWQRAYFFEWPKEHGLLPTIWRRLPQKVQLFLDYTLMAGSWRDRLYIGTIVLHSLARRAKQRLLRSIPLAWAAG